MNASGFTQRQTAIVQVSLPSHEPNADDALTSPYLDAQTRAQLRRDAEPTETLELQPCQRLTDYQLRLRP